MERAKYVDLLKGSETRAGLAVLLEAASGITYISAHVPFWCQIWESARYKDKELAENDLKSLENLRKELGAELVKGEELVKQNSVQHFIRSKRERKPLNKPVLGLEQLRNREAWLENKESWKTSFEERRKQAVKPSWIISIGWNEELNELVNESFIFSALKDFYDENPNKIKKLESFEIKIPERDGNYKIYPDREDFGIILSANGINASVHCFSERCITIKIADKESSLKLVEIISEVKQSLAEREAYIQGLKPSEVAPVLCATR